MKTIERQIHFLYVYTTASRQQQSALTKTMSKSQLYALLEVIFNVLKGTIDITRYDKRLLKRYKRVIRQVVDRGVSEDKKRTLLLKHSRIFRRIVQIALKYILDKHGSRVGSNTKR